MAYLEEKENATLRLRETTNVFPFSLTNNTQALKKTEIQKIKNKRLYRSKKMCLWAYKFISEFQVQHYLLLTVNS